MVQPHTVHETSTKEKRDRKTGKAMNRAKQQVNDSGNRVPWLSVCAPTVRVIRQRGRGMGRRRWR